MRTAAACALAITLTSLDLGAQSGAPVPAFEVASVKVNRTSEPESGGFEHGRLTIRAAPLRHLVGAAYDVRIDLVAGGPNWIDTDRFDIEAKTDPAASEAMSRQMLQTLLADRFKLRVHREHRRKPVFLLTVVKKGPKLQESDPGSTERSRCAGTSPVTCHQRTMAQLTDLLRRISTGIEIPVIDETGLKGRYDFQLRFAERDGQVDTPSIFDALQQQLGLKLKAAKRPIQFLVVDRADRTPAAN